MVIKNRETIIKAIEAKVGNKACPSCGKLAGYMTGIDEHQIIGFDRTLNGLDLTPSGEHDYIPCVAVICKHCGNVRMFALEVLLGNPNYIKDSL